MPRTGYMRSVLMEKGLVGVSYKYFVMRVLCVLFLCCSIICNLRVRRVVWLAQPFVWFAPIAVWLCLLWFMEAKCLLCVVHCVYVFQVPYFYGFGVE